MSIALAYIFWENIAKTNAFGPKQPKRKQNDVYTDASSLRIYARIGKVFSIEDGHFGYVLDFYVEIMYNIYNCAEGGSDHG